MRKSHSASKDLNIFSSLHLHITFVKLAPYTACRQKAKARSESSLTKNISMSFYGTINSLKIEVSKFITWKKKNSLLEEFS